MISKISINSSSNSSTSSATPVANLINSWGKSKVSSCVFGMSKIGWASNVTNWVSHTALLLMNIDFDINSEEGDIEKKTGILVEYGDYHPNMCDTEKDYSNNGYVVYRYGDNGGLRYYGKKYSEFIKEFGDIGYIDLNIDEYNQKTFSDLINRIAKVEDNKWIQKKYSAVNNFNCQTFVLEALKEIKPYFHSGDVYPADKKLQIKKYKARLEFLPQYMMNELIKYYKK